MKWSRPSHRLRRRSKKGRAAARPSPVGGQAGLGPRRRRPRTDQAGRAAAAIAGGVLRGASEPEIPGQARPRPGAPTRRCCRSRRPAPRPPQNPPDSRGETGPVPRSDPLPSRGHEARLRVSAAREFEARSTRNSRTDDQRDHPSLAGKRPWSTIPITKKPPGTRDPCPPAGSKQPSPSGPRKVAAAARDPAVETQSAQSASCSRRSPIIVVPGISTRRAR